MNNKEKSMIGIVLVSVLLITISISYAYFTATFQNLGERETSITAAEMGSLKLTSEEASYTSGDQYPGDIAIQKFEVEPVIKGKGVYELDLTGVIDETIFGTDVEVSLYKSIDTTEVTVTQGELTQEGSNFSRVDTLVTNGLTPVYTGSLKNGLNILFQEEFEVVSDSGTLKIKAPQVTSSYERYTFYLVYNYKDNGNQNNQMGNTFSGTISGKIIKQLNGAGTLAKLAGNADKTSTAVIDNGEVLDGEEVLCTNTLAYDDFGNLRYVGANPCNYVTFNNEAPAVNDAYQAYLDGALITNRIGTYDTEEACTSQLTQNRNIKAELGIDSELTCELDTTTNKYHVVGHGFIKNYGSFGSQEECLSGMSSWGLTYQSSTTPPDTITCRANGKMASGGWRVIGIIDGKIKLIRNESIGNYSWDSSASSINSGWGINQWGESGEYKGADLMKLLNPRYDTNLAEDSSGNTIAGTYANNSLYWNKGTGNCYNAYQNGYTTCDFSTTGLTENAKAMIASTTWNLGSQGSNDVEFTSGNGLGLASKFYEYERSNNTGKICSSGDYCNDSVNRTTTWEGFVGLMSPSDYGYAVGGEARTNCLANTNLYHYSTNNCYTNDWLFNSTTQWIMPPSATGASNMFYVYSDGGVRDGHIAYTAIDVRPALFLIPSVDISGSGTPTDPFTLKAE